MRLSERVRERLDANADARVVYTRVWGAPEVLPSVRTTSIEYWVVALGGLYEPKALQTFMQGLLPALPWCAKLDFRRHADLVYFGRLVYDEEVAREPAPKHDELDPTLLAAYGDHYAHMYRPPERSVVERTVVRPFPDERFVQVALDEGTHDRPCFGARYIEQFRPCRTGTSRFLFRQ